MASLRRRRRTDGGFTLVEVVVAMVLMSITMAAVAVLFVGGIRNSAGLQRRQAAVVVAQQALEAVRAVPVTPEGGCVKLLQGRVAGGPDPQADVTQQWSNPPQGVSLAGMTPATGCPGSLVVPLTGIARSATSVLDPVTLNGLPYTVRTYIGQCRVTDKAAILSALAATQDTCTTANTGPLLYRVLVAVTWTANGCAAGCVFTAGTLVDPSTDPVYNVRAAGPPVANPDALCFRTGVPAAFSVVANDTGVLGKRPVTVVTPGAAGRVGSTIATGVATYRPPSTAGTDSFTYKLTDVNGVVSSTVTVSITVTNGACP